MTTSCSDPVIGELRYNGRVWSGSVRTGTLGGAVFIGVEPTDGPNRKRNTPSEVRRFAFTSFHEHEVSVMALVREELLSYHALRWTRTSEGDGDADTLGLESVPPPDRPEEVLAGFGPAELFVPNQHDPLDSGRGP